MSQFWPNERDENRAMDEIPNREDFFQLFKPKEDGNYDVLGFEFNQIEVAQAKDFYAMCDTMSIFYLPREELIHFLDEVGIEQNLGARLCLAILIREEDSGFFLLKEDDKRLIGVSKKRLTNEKWGVDLDCNLILPN